MAIAMTGARQTCPTPSPFWTNEPWIDDAATVLDQTDFQAAPELSLDRPDNEMSNIDKLVAAFVRVRGLNRLDGGIISRCWLAHDMNMSTSDLDSLLSLLRWQGLVRLPNPDLVVVDDAAAMREIALSCPPLPSVVVPLHRNVAA